MIEILFERKWNGKLSIPGLIPTCGAGAGDMIEILFERTWNGKLSIPGLIPPWTGGGGGGESFQP